MPAPATSKRGHFGGADSGKWGHRVALTDAQAKNAKATDRPIKLADSHGLFLFVTPGGVKSWRWKYRFDGKEKQLVLGRYPAMGIGQARRLREQFGDIRRAGQDPAFAKSEAKLQAAVDRMETFEAVARRWHEQQKRLWRPKHAANVLRQLENDVFPAIGKRPIGQIKAPAVLALLRDIEERGAHDQAHRTRQRIDAIFAAAIGMGLADSNPAAMVGKALAPVIIGRYPALRSLERARALIEASEAAPGNPITKLANRFIAVTAARSEAVRYSEWPELEQLGSDQAQWRIPGAHMKGQREQRSDPDFEFIVPLPPQAVEIVEAVRPLTGNARMIFGGVRDPRKPMSDSTLSALYRRLPAFAGQHVPHGWRSTFSTIMNEWADEHGRAGDRAIIDLMLAHKPQGVEGIYNRAAYMPRRRELATIWAGMLLDGLPPAASLLEGKRC
jgi:integrase